MIDTSNHMMMIPDYIRTTFANELRVGGITYIKDCGLGIHQYTATIVHAKTHDQQPTVEVETLVLFVEGDNVIHHERINITNL